MRVVAAVLAAGKGERFGGDKVSASLGGPPVWRWSLDTLRRHPLVDSVGLVVPPGRLARFDTAEADFLVEGGENRQESSRIAVEAAQGDIVLIQDAARPFVGAEVITRVIEAIERTGAAAPGAPVTDTLRRRSDNRYEIVDRALTVAMQTPQGATRECLVEAHRRAHKLYTDEMALIEAIGGRYEIVEGDPRNFKITTEVDLERARAMVGGVETRTGIGYDIHRFSTVAGRPLMLGGLRFEGHPGLEGHSDADVVIHAAVDAMLGAASLGDIGQHFPNNDPRWKGVSSVVFLKHAAAALASHGWDLIHLDIAMIGEMPKVMPRAVEIRSLMAEALGVDVERVSLKATTNEGLGSLGRGEGIAAYAVATIRKRGLWS